MTDRYHGGTLSDFEVTATITIPAANSRAAIHRAQEELGILKPGWAEWEARPA